MKQALFIGRFQPFHLGHLSVVKKAIKEFDRVIIGIGSAEDSFLPDNPFTASERFQMIEAALGEAGIPAEKHCIAPVRNILNYELWPDHVDQIVPPYEAVLTGSKLVKTLFQNQGKHKIIDVKFEHDICSTDVREKMLQDKGWQSMVPSAVAKLIEKFDGITRIKNIQK
ncbi:MAG: nicotinamide-nucleotide adenylyltransferase [Patescibacteria group bacterium]|nr:nicotinamide-nucleotide adenylyltransferase [Patescibacteria group bacterium]